eukprot:TRINITY_DN31424_c0_g1_i1.p2 TRINITY_DN31424_c0_g1~~TRINITY_DN31424_c0_g1_i1.p2  ORF type:complete len:249 (-),score=12.59 TRINITY_DN31424_c0_g1_i1:573-1319(-)
MDTRLQVQKISDRCYLCVFFFCGFVEHLCPSPKFVYQLDAKSLGFQTFLITVELAQIKLHNSNLNFLVPIKKDHMPYTPNELNFQCLKNFREKFISAIQFLFLVNHTGVAIRRGIIRIRGNQQKEEYGIFCGILRTFALVVPFAKKCWSQAVQIVSVWLQLWLFSSLQSATLVVKLVKQQYYWQLYYQYQCQQQRLVFFIESIQYVLKRCDCWGDVSFLMGLGIVFCCFRASLNLKFPPVLGGNFKLR